MIEQAKPQSGRDSYRKLKRTPLFSVLLELKSFKSFLGIGTCLVILEKVSSILVALTFKHVVDGLNKTGQNSLNYIFVLLAIYGLLRWLSPTLTEIRDYIFSNVSEMASKAVGSKVLQEILENDFSYFTNIASGKITRDLDRGVSGVSFFLRYLIFNGLPTMLEIVVVVVFIGFYIGVWYSIVASIGCILYFITSLRLNEWRSNYVRQVNFHNSEANHVATEALSSPEIIRLYRLKEIVSKKYDDSLGKWASSRIKDRFILALVTVTQAMIIAASLTFILNIAVVDFSNHIITTGDFVILSMLLSQIFTPLNLLGFVYRELRQSIVDIDGMYSHLSPANCQRQHRRTYTLSDPIKKSSIHSVALQHENGNRPLNGVSLELSSGTSTAIIGLSGSGKSSLIKCITGLFEISEGQIFINDLPINTIDLESFHARIAVVPQDTFIFEGTIKDNITLFSEKFNDDAVYRSVASSGLHSFVNKHRDGIMAQVGSRGTLLSGGEKQRIGIARALLKSPDVLILDEATANLDAITEASIYREILGKKSDLITIIVTHNLNAIDEVDTIYAMRNGKIEKVEGHRELSVSYGEINSILN